jgi:hypothetical protein
MVNALGMPLQNRVTPFGELTIVPARGLLMGNRGGRLHDTQRELGSRRWSSKQWICCKLDFNNRHRKVWGDSYSELFFLDEVTAFAAGHRPCFECRRKDAQAFAALFPGKDKAPEMDEVLHAQRLDGKAKRLHRRNIDALPDGAMIVLDDAAFAVRGRCLLRWMPSGYGETCAQPRGIEADVLTPPAILKVLEKGYAPLWHPSAVIGGQKSGTLR